MEEYDIEVYNNDTYNGMLIEIIINGAPLDLTGSSIRMQVRKIRDNTPVITISDGNGITITDAPAGKFRIDEQVFSVDKPDTFLYDIEITLASGKVKTYIKGNFVVERDITYG